MVAGLVKTKPMRPSLPSFLEKYLEDLEEEINSLIL